jgi:hypothetical protein
MKNYPSPFRIKTYITNQQRFIHSTEIKLPYPIKRLSPVLSKLKTKKVLVKIQIGKEMTGTYWGLPAWVENGKIKKGFEPDLSILKNYEIKVA